MKTVPAIILTLALMFPAMPVLADECLEGDCYNGSGKGFIYDGKIYAGEWIDGEPHGFGRLFVSKDKIVEGRWQKGKLLEEKKVNEVSRGK